MECMIIQVHNRAGVLLKQILQIKSMNADLGNGNRQHLYILAQFLAALRRAAMSWSVAFLLLIRLALAARALPFPTSPPVSMMFVFGDSIFDVGNNNFVVGSVAQANVTPYGTTAFGFPTGRFSDGRLIPDYIAQFLGFPYVPAYLQPGASFLHGINFASAGSGLLNTTDAALRVIPLDTQMEQFQHVSRLLRDHIGEYLSSMLFGRSLFLVTVGSNDIFSNFIQATLDRRGFLTTLMAIYRKNILQLYTNGARRIVVFNLGPLGCTPMLRRLLRGACLNLANELAVSFNVALRWLVHELSSTLPGIQVSYAKGFDAVSGFMSNASAYGFADTQNACCGECGGLLATHGPQAVCDNPNEYLFWDFIHPTEFTNSILAKSFWEGDSSYIEPFNIKTLAMGYNAQQQQKMPQAQQQQKLPHA